MPNSPNPGPTPEEFADRADKRQARREALYDKGGFLPGPIAVTNDTGKPERVIRHDRPTYGKPKNGDDQ